LREICIEVVPKGNSNAEMAEKRQLYFEAGALEVWLCDESGRLRFFEPGGEISDSRCAPGFPALIEI
jgi:hypothetical protein